MKHTYKTKSAGFNVNAYTPAPRSCASQISPAAACRLARTERNTQEGFDTDRVYGRSGWWSAFRGAQRPSWFRCLHCSDFERRRRSRRVARSRQRCTITRKFSQWALLFPKMIFGKTGGTLGGRTGVLIPT